ncbi:ATP synthase A chain family protein [Mycobacterium xenopi 3993]|nr:ATP synthase A chain family protein [Mycobacterium xenopi 3993]
MFVCYHTAGIARRGILGHPVKLLKGHVAALAPINMVEEVAKPISLSLRLFGNIFAGGIMVALIALFPRISCGRPTPSGRRLTCSSGSSRRLSSRC